MKPRVICRAYWLAHVRGYTAGGTPGRREGRAVPGECLWIYECVAAPGVGREIAAEKGIKRMQGEGLLAGPEAGGWLTAATGGSQQSALSGSYFKPPPLVEVLTTRPPDQRERQQTLQPFRVSLSLRDPWLLPGTLER